MARRVLFVAAILSLLVSADYTAWAVLTSASVVLIDHGQAIPGATIILSRPHHPRARAVASGLPASPQPVQPAPQPPTSPAPAQTASTTLGPAMEQNWVVAKSDPTGRVLLQFDDQDALPDTQVDIIVTYPNGETFRRFNVPIETIRNGGALEVAVIGTATAEPANPSADLALIPAPPVVTIGSTVHQAQQDLHNPDRAYDRTTGRALFFDRDRKSWIDPMTREALGFEGALAADGTIIPAPPMVAARSGGKHQAQQDKSNPERAYDSVTGQVLIWDRTHNTWIDTKTQKPVGFEGAYVSGPAGPGPSSPAMGFGFGFGSGGFGSGGFDSGGGPSGQSEPMQQERRIGPAKKQ